MSEKKEPDSRKFFGIKTLIPMDIEKYYNQEQAKKH